MQTLLILRESGPRRVQPLLPRAIEPFIEGQIIFATQMPRQQKKNSLSITHIKPNLKDRKSIIVWLRISNNDILCKRWNENHTRSLLNIFMSLAIKGRLFIAEFDTKISKNGVLLRSFCLWSAWKESWWKLQFASRIGFFRLRFHDDMNFGGRHYHSCSIIQ